MLNRLLSRHKDALVVGPGGLGDHIWMSGAVRYIASQYVETHLFCSMTVLPTLKQLYSDAPSVKLLPVRRFDDDLRRYIRAKYRDIYVCALTRDLYIRPVDMDDLPGVFYDQLGIPRSVRHSHFALPALPRSLELYRTLGDQPYIFAHTVTSNCSVEFVSWDIQKTLTINPNVNMYAPGDPWYELAQKFVNKPFLDYCDTIKRARELHLANSSFYTLATQIPPLDATVKVCYDRHSCKVIAHYDFS